MKAMHEALGTGPRACVLSSNLENAVDRVLVLEMAYAHAVRRMVARSGAQHASFAAVDAAREMASRLLIAWGRNPALEQHAVVAQDALADVMEKTIVLASRGSEPMRPRLVSAIRSR